MSRSVLLVEFSPSGGLFQFSFQLGEALARRGHRVQLVTGPDPELTSQVPGMQVRPMLPTWHPSAGAQDPRLVRKLRRVIRALWYHLAWLKIARVLRRERPDVVQWSTWRFPLDGWMVHRLARRAGNPVMVTVAHAPQPFNEQRRNGEVFKGGTVLERCLDLGYASVDAVLVLGERSATELRAARRGAHRVEVVPHGDEGIFLRGEPSDVTGTDPVALFFGTLQAYKGVDVLVDAFELVRERLPDARLIIAGTPTGEVDVDVLRRRAELAGGVEWRLGYVPTPDVAELVSTARVVVAPYRYANASGVAHLAHTFARPVVATAVGDLATAVQDGVSGLIVPPGDRAALADALSALLVDPARAATLGRAGRDRLAERSWPVVAQRVEAVYESCLAARRGDDEARVTR